VAGDAPAMGRVMVQSWLSAHRGQMPDEAWQRRVDEWTPEVSAAGWRRLLAERSDGDHPRVVLLVAEDAGGEIVALVLGTEAEDDASGSTARIDALYVQPGRHGQGIGRSLLQEAASQLAALGFSKLLIGVLTANLPARAFYEAMGGHHVGERTFDEEGTPLPETVYAWPDIASMTGATREPS
jgi:ribosomal protein S18 acetylase RimI-like enzyme